MHMSLSGGGAGGLGGLKKICVVIIERSLRLRHMHREQFATNEKKADSQVQKGKKVHEIGPEQRGEKVTKGRELNICT